MTDLGLLLALSCVLNVILFFDRRSWVKRYEKDMTELGTKWKTTCLQERDEWKKLIEQYRQVLSRR